MSGKSLLRTTYRKSLVKMGTPFAELAQYRDLLFMLTWRDIRLRYKQSVMGFLWAILMPSLIVAAGALVRYAFAIGSGRALNPTDIASVSLKSLPWAFFVGAIRFATTSLTSNRDLITKVYFPREVFPLSAVFASLFDFAVASGVIILILIVARVGLSFQLLWLPLLLALLIAFTASVAIFFSCANLFFRDVKYLVEVFLTFGVLFTPVFYEAKSFGRWAPILLLNPVGAILEAMNDVVILHKPPDFAWLAYAACWALFGFWVSWKIFHSAEPSFAESI